MIGSKLRCLLACAFVVPLAVVGLPAASANVPYQIIGSPGPLSSIVIGNELSCQISHTGDTTPEFFGPTPGDCGTFLFSANDNTLYAPNFANHDFTATGNLRSYTAYTPVSQTPVTGSGTAADPFKVVTVVSAGTSGLVLTETDSYVVGQESYRTDVQVQNTSTVTRTGVFYRAGDCYLQGSDFGYGYADSSSRTVACTTNANNSPPARIEEWVPITGGASYYEDFYGSVWAVIGSHRPFNNSCACNIFQDNGAGLSFNISISAEQSITISHLTTFSPTGNLTLVTTKTADVGTVSSGTTDGYTITVSNPNSSNVTLSSIDDTLPSGFSYVPGSTSGVTTSDPSVSGSTLTWNGSFVVPARQNVTLHFRVQTSTSEPNGTYYDNAGATATNGYSVSSTGPTAPVTVMASCNTPPTTLAASGAPSTAARQVSRLAQGTPSRLVGGPTATVEKGYGKLPLSFEANRGQFDRHVRFVARSSGLDLYLTVADAVLRTALPVRTGGTQSEQVLRLHFAGASANVRSRGLHRLPGIVNYLIGSNSRVWHIGIPTYSGVGYRNMYPGIDLVYYGHSGRVEYDWVLHPGARLAAIRLQVEGMRGASAQRIDRQDNLVVGAQGREIRLSKPLIYQVVKGVRKAVSGGYVRREHGLVGFRVGKYDHGKPLVIDPVVIYSTHLGGSSIDSGRGIAVDASGNAYVAGSTSSTDFPSGTGPAFQSGNHGCLDAFVAKLNSTGNQLLYKTYLGGSATDEALGIALDATGNTYVSGYTASSDFPTTGGYQSTNRGAVANAFVVKLNATGTQLLYGTYLGGGADDRAKAIAVDGSGNAYITGYTTSANFPIQNQLQSALQGSQDAFVAKLNPNLSGAASLVYSTYLGGRGVDSGNGIAVDSVGSAYVTGQTSSSDFPTPMAYQGALRGSANAFVAKFNAAGNALAYGTYLGGTGTDGANGIAVDGAGSAYVTGFTSSSNFPTVGPFQAGLKGTQDAFVTRLTSTGSELGYSTYLGGGQTEAGYGIALDRSGNAYITGRTNSADFPTANTNHTSNAGGVCVQGDGSRPCFDAFVTELGATGSTALFSAYLGGTGDDSGYGTAVDPAGSFYVTGQTSSGDFPVANAYQGTSNGLPDAFVMKFSPGPTAARISRFTARRQQLTGRGALVVFRWRMSGSEGLAGFNAYAGTHRLNRQLIPVHRSRSYHYEAPWSRGGPFSLQVVLVDGRSVWAHA